MRLVTYTYEGKGAGSLPRIGALLGDGQRILDFYAALEIPETLFGHEGALLAWFDLDGSWLPRASALYEKVSRDEAASEGLRRALVKRAETQLLAPVPRPGKLICIGLNYRDHAAESKMAIPESPVVFSKFVTAVVGCEQPVILPPASVKSDYEAELAVVIGRRAKGVRREEAFDCVLGYTNFNDVSERGFQFTDGQWQRGKSCDTFAPMGPYLVTKDEIPDPHALSIRLRLNGQTMQDSNTQQLIFDIPELISFLSETITLEPGDVIATGTPPGVGFARQPPVFLRSGDVMEVEIEGLGILANPVV